jgi:hypothetical protein
MKTHTDRFDLKMNKLEEENWKYNGGLIRIWGNVGGSNVLHVAFTFVQLLSSARNRLNFIRTHLKFYRRKTKGFYLRQRAHVLYYIYVRISPRR